MTPINKDYLDNKGFTEATLPPNLQMFDNNTLWFYDSLAFYSDEENSYLEFFNYRFLYQEDINNLLNILEKNKK